MSAFVVQWRRPGTSETQRSQVFSGMTAVSDAHYFAVLKTPPKGFVFDLIKQVGR